jgi:hypothetical protein
VRLAYSPNTWKLLAIYKNCARSCAAKIALLLYPQWVTYMKGTSL